MEEIIEKPKELFKVKPNLKDYEEKYKTFRWEDANKEIDWLDTKLNAAFDAVDRHAKTWRRNKVALYWEGENKKEEYTFQELSNLSNKFANVLKKLNVKKGDRVFIFLPRILPLYVSFLGILKTGAIAGTMFSAFGPEGIRDRLQDSEAKFLITDSELKKRVYEVRNELPNLKHIIVVGEAEGDEISYEDEMKNASREFEIEKTDPEDYAFMLFSSGTTGRAKGIVHVHYSLVQEHITAKWVLDLHEEDRYWCVPPGTEVITNPCPKKIEEVKIGDKILSHNGNFCKVNQLFKRKYNGDLIKIKTYYFYEPFFLTPNHAVLSGQRGKKAIKWLPAGKLTKNDFVLFPRIRKAKNINSISLSEFVKDCKVIDGCIVYKNKVKTKIKDNIEINKKIMRLIGYYIAEGSLASHDRTIQFSFGKKEEKLANDVKRLLKDVFSLNSSKLFHKGLLEVRANSVVVAKFFKNLFGKKSYEKKLPEWSFYLPEEELGEFIKGFWLGDGDTDKDGFRFSTTSKALAYQLKIILFKLGIIASLKCRKKENIPISKLGNRDIIAKNDCYTIKVGGKSLIKLSKILGKRHPFIKKRWCTYNFGSVTNNYIWIPIRAIEKVHYEGYVHNIRTEANSYSLSNMIVHNCTADPGWVTGVAYGILGSWSNAASSVVYEGRFDPDRWYSIIQDYQVTVWYTAPTAIRMLMAAGDELPKKYDLSSLRHICSVGEPLNPEAIRWSLKVLGLPIHDNWWQTESGGIMIANYPCMPIKLGSMGKPLPGITAAIVDDNGNKLPTGQPGNLAIKYPWPAMMREIWKNPEKYNSYFKNNWYITGDIAFKDKDGYFWFVGRADDVIKTAGERVGPFEVESTLIEHPAVIEAGVIGKPDPLRGEIIKAFIVLRKTFEPSDQLKEELKDFVKKKLAGHAYPREIEFVSSLPKTRSGKIMRRVLKAKELGLPIGDISALEEF